MLHYMTKTGLVMRDFVIKRRISCSGRLVAPKRHIPVLVVVVPMLPIAMTIKDHLLPLLLLWPLLGMFRLLMLKKKLLSVPAAPLLLHRFMARASSLSLFPSRAFHQSCRSPPWLLILLVAGFLLYQLTTITGLGTSGP